MDRVSLVLVIIGALNWASVGLFKLDFVAYTFGGATTGISRVIYTLIGVAGIWCVSLLFRDRHNQVEDM